MTTKELKVTRAGRYLYDTIDEDYKEYKKRLKESGRLNELMEEAIEIEKELMSIAEQEFLKKNPVPHSEYTIKEFNTVMSMQKEIANNEIAELAEHEIDVLNGRWKEFDIDEYLETLK